MSAADLQLRLNACRDQLYRLSSLLNPTTSSKLFVRGRGMLSDCISGLEGDLRCLKDLELQKETGKMAYSERDLSLIRRASLSVEYSEGFISRFIETVNSSPYFDEDIKTSVKGVLDNMRIIKTEINQAVQVIIDSIAIMTPVSDHRDAMFGNTPRDSAVFNNTQKEGPKL